MKKYPIAAALSVASAHVFAQPGAQPAADPATAGQAVPATRYVSPLAQYRPARDLAQPPAATWAATNAAVARQDGMAGMSHEGHQEHAGHARQQPAAQQDHGHHGHGHGAGAQKEPQR
ncbi:hypothetical protein IP92_04789 [Pseudoduganella flava]|uniref:Uncharacterized protein n=1 Tax=Pseudoduganella flava TaxID=871742 RepID=A0A562PIA8_9BURK|nr:hypothetical protein [Pseudoduganella flava]QGZ42583.1 hypothetical protein GO485_28475 [Pseudoduganella flava]TWI43736.1 hypothetical protein IP92_04789 [Pseudoduganella flava]